MLPLSMLPLSMLPLSVLPLSMLPLCMFLISMLLLRMLPLSMLPSVFYPSTGIPAVDFPDCRQEAVQLTEPSGTFHSFQFPINYPNMVCQQWSITVEQGRVGLISMIMCIVLQGNL